MTTVTLDHLTGIIDAAWGDYQSILANLSLDNPASTGGWTPRQVLSHVIGAWNRTPLQAGFFLAGANAVPVLFHDPYWISEYQNAPLPAFRAALLAALEGNKAFLRSLEPADLDCTIPLPDFGGEVSLGSFLVNSYQRHITDMHMPQLRAFLPT
ncbi:MAG: DinB family protein [Anaerolineae bacterium]|nr:DinB family protein [Anaerolineae bacterium]